MYRKLVVPLDGSPFGEHALPLALNLARRTQAEIRLLRVHRSLEASYAEMQLLDGSLDGEIRQQEQRYLEAIAQRLRDASAALKVQTVLAEGEVATAIREDAKKTGADLVVMTTHARGPFGRFWLGSVVDDLLRDLPVPMLLTHPEPELPALHNEFTFKHILVPLDGTPLAEQILPSALPLASAFDSQITLLRVIQPLLPAAAPVGHGTLSDMANRLAQDIDKIHAQLTAEARDYLEGLAQRLRIDGFTAKTVVVAADQPGVGILKEAGKLSADAIALETHGRRGLSRLILGSVADKVLRGSTIPMLVNRPTA